MTIFFEFERLLNREDDSPVVIHHIRPKDGVA